MAEPCMRKPDAEPAGAPIVFMTGSFDPFHAGHLAAIEIALRELRPDRLLLFPEWQKPGKELSPMGRRLRELILKTAHLDGVHLDLARHAILKQGGLTALHHALKQCYAGRRLIQLSGSDSFLEAWRCGGVHEGNKLGIESAVVPRPGYDVPTELPCSVRRLSPTRAVPPTELRAARHA